ncbi:YibE/F family protein [Candidatus Syntrophocurvum alkaliphilum]|uniref:YibE/F family protein n=1 Tax=Candidatus Syntrophocurvum alkaliphilum TaxID=2293317 RepID=A0A6I6D7C9_9FIRM|nr:YibE/F family protein [Candidatus Syntrophocurvum alkaliphilum]QGT99023.1 YibE/F family protein [Candidatus Syntrophocurvum alkaliphilum]
MQFRKLILVFVLLLVFIFINVGTVASAYSVDSDFTDELWEKALVLEVKDLDSSEPSSGYFSEQTVTIEILSGDFKGQVLQAQNTLSGSPGWDIAVTEGDKVIVYITTHEGEIVELNIADYARADYINYLLIGFMGVLIVVGGIKGIKALVALGFTALAIYKFLLPALLAGYAPLPITIAILTGVTIVTMTIIGGLTKKAFSATIGTIGGVIFAGLLAYFIGTLASLTGLATEESRMLLYVDNLNIDIRGLLFSGIIIGALGATMDVAMSVASSVDEIKKANPNLTTIDLIKAGMNVGRDIMGTMVNTLVLAYAGGALPMLLLYMTYATPGAVIFNSEFIATEILRAVAGSIGLILSVPITAVVSGIIYEQTSDHKGIEYNS